jgi:hypothetical protein
MVQLWAMASRFPFSLRFALREFIAYGLNGCPEIVVTPPIIPEEGMVEVRIRVGLAGFAGDALADCRGSGVIGGTGL